jgi:antitoxin VapB
LRGKQEAVAQVDAAFIAASRPGARIADIFRKGVEAYAKVGYPDEWKLHHQGGLAGYEPREHVATPASSQVVKAGQAFAWNPSITGTKSEDTILSGEMGCEVITAMEDWPRIPVQVEGQLIERPAILEVA